MKNYKSASSVDIPQAFGRSGPAPQLRRLPELPANRQAQVSLYASKPRLKRGHFVDLAL